MCGPGAGLSLPAMTTETLRETVDELGRRLARIGAAASSLSHVSADIRHDVPPSDLLTLLQQIEHDLMLASSQLEIAHNRAKLEIDSLRSPR